MTKQDSSDCRETVHPHPCRKYNCSHVHSFKRGLGGQTACTGELSDWHDCRKHVVLDFEGEPECDICGEPVTTSVNTI